MASVNLVKERQKNDKTEIENNSYEVNEWINAC